MNKLYNDCNTIDINKTVYYVQVVYNLNGNQCQGCFFHLTSINCIGHCLYEQIYKVVKKDFAISKY